MRLYKVDKCRYTEIDVNSIEGIMLVNRLFDESDLDPQKRFSVVRLKNDRNEWFLLSLDDESFEDILDNGTFKYLTDTFNENSDNVRRIRSMVKDIIHDEELEPWFDEVLLGNNVIITIRDKGTDISIKPREDDDTEGGNDNETISDR